MNTLVVLPTLDGTREAAVRRLEAWSTAPTRRKMIGASFPLYATMGDVADREAMLDVHVIGGKL